MFQRVQSQSSGISCSWITEPVSHKTVGKLMESKGKKQWRGENDELGNKFVHYVVFNKSNKFYPGARFTGPPIG